MKTKYYKNTRMFLVIGLVLLSSVLLTGCTKKSPPVENPPVVEPTAEPTKPIEETISQRSYVSLVPAADVHRVYLTIKNVPSNITSVNYELIYLADMEGNKIERGVTGKLQPADYNKSKEILFGSASCTTGTCKYKYDEGVNEGTLTLTFNKNDGGKDKYESVFRIQKGKEGGIGLSTGDGEFMFVSIGLPASTVYLTISTIGVPVELPAGIIPKTIPYGIFSSGAIKGGTVSFKTPLSSPIIYAYDGKSWNKLTTEVADGKAKATSGTGQYIFILTE